MIKIKIPHFSLKVVWQSYLCLFLALLLASPAHAALPDSVLDELYAVGAHYYNPMGNNRFSSGCFGAMGANMNYAGATVFSAGEMQAIEQNRPFYEAASAEAEAQGFYIPWQVIATVHSMESSLRRTNPANGQGAYQLYSYVQSHPKFLPAGAISDEEFQRQTNIAVLEVMRAKASGLDLSNSEDVKQFFLNYNGSGGGHYLAKAQAMFGPSAKAYEGSPYVMNRYDAQRDPQSSLMSEHWKGAYMSDGVYDPNATWRSTYGAFVKYEALGGGSSSVSCGNLISGGMTFDQAKDFMQLYRDITPREWGTNGALGTEWDIAATNTCTSDLENCVAFTQYFINRYTTDHVLGLPDGRNVVSRLLSRPGYIDGGTTPRPYAIFSTSITSSYGHTGVVLGINEETNTIIIGEAGCSASFEWTNAHEYSLDNYTNGNYVYAYTDNILKGNF